MVQFHLISFAMLSTPTYSDHSSTVSFDLDHTRERERERFRWWEKWDFHKQAKQFWWWLEGFQINNIMGKQGSPRTRRCEAGGMKKHQFRCSEGNHHHHHLSCIIGSKRAFLLHETIKLSSHNYGYGWKRLFSLGNHFRFVALLVGVMLFLFLLDSLLLSIFDSSHLQIRFMTGTSSIKPDNTTYDIDIAREENTSVVMYDRLLNLATSAVAKKELRRYGGQTHMMMHTSTWKPCAKTSPAGINIPEKPRVSNGFILVSANGGLNQQRVAVCNAVAVASLLNATLVIPTFLYSNVWKDPSQFGDIYQEEYFIKTLKNDVTIVKELPPHLRSIDLEAIGSVITDSDLVKEANPHDYMRLVLPLLLRNGIVHFLGFANRLGFHPFPSTIQKLRCKCNFHALKFVPKIQKLGSLVVRRLRKNDSLRNMIDKQLLGRLSLMKNKPSKTKQLKISYVDPNSKYLALHLRFEEDMVAYSRCDFGGGETERRELQAYREIHFPLMLQRINKSITPAELRLSGRCPLTPEESALVLAGLGFKRRTYIYLAGSQIYGAQTRMKPLTSLYPNLVTKEDLLSPSELEPLRNFSSQLAALDFIACATADVFAITDSGSQLSSLVSGYRTYFGGGQAPILRPNKKTLAAILLQNSTIGWSDFEDSIKKMIEQGQTVHRRGYTRSLYRHPTTPECMCRSR